MFLEQALKQTVDLSKPLKVLDLCAAPGGKSTHLLSLISKDSLLVSNEVIRTRANILNDNIIKNAIIEKGKNVLSFVCSLFFNIKTAPNDARTSPNSSGWCDHEINPSMPKISWDIESPKPDIIWTIDPAMTSFIPVFREPWIDFLSISMQPMIAAQLVIDTPKYTTMWEGLQKNSGSFCRWDIASQNPAETTTIGPMTAKIDTNETSVVDFASVEFESLVINFILSLYIIGLFEIL